MHVFTCPILLARTAGHWYNRNSGRLSASNGKHAISHLVFKQFQDQTRQTIPWQRVLIMHPDPQTPAPDALLFVASQCPHCPTVLRAMAELVKSGRIRQLQVFNIEQAAEEAARHGVRSVPWIRIGPFELTGLHSEQELTQWVERTASPRGQADYLVELITHGQLAEARAFLQRDPAHRKGLVELLGDPDTELSVRIGAGALVEELAETDFMPTLLPDLVRLTRHDDARIRGDAAHYLALSGDPSVLPELQRLETDPDAEVREIAAEGLADLAGTSGKH
jgi:glutaredoxin